MLVSMAVMLISSSLTRLGAVSGAWATAAFVVGVAAAVATIVFAIRSFGSRREAPPVQE